MYCPITNCALTKKYEELMVKYWKLEQENVKLADLPDLILHYKKRLDEMKAENASLKNCMNCNHKGCSNYNIKKEKRFGKVENCSIWEPMVI